MVADRVIDRLEAVDVEVDDGEVAVGAGLRARRRLDELREAHAVLEAGHRIGAGGDELRRAPGERTGPDAMPCDGDGKQHAAEQRHQDRAKSGLHESAPSRGRDSTPRRRHGGRRPPQVRRYDSEEERSHARPDRAS